MAIFHYASASLNCYLDGAKLIFYDSISYILQNSDQLFDLILCEYSIKMIKNKGNDKRGRAAPSSGGAPVITYLEKNVTISNRQRRDAAFKSTTQNY